MVCLLRQWKNKRKCCNLGSFVVVVSIQFKIKHDFNSLHCPRWMFVFFVSMPFFFRVCKWVKLTKPREMLFQHKNCFNKNFPILTQTIQLNWAISSDVSYSVEDVQVHSDLLVNFNGQMNYSLDMNKSILSWILRQYILHCEQFSKAAII